MEFEKFLPCKYNHCIESETGYLLMFCASTGKFVKVAGEKKEKVLMLLNSKEPIDKNDIPRELINFGFFVPEDYDYHAMAKMLYLKIAESSDVLKISILCTEQCNFRCVYCNEPFEKGKMPEDVQDNIIEFLRKMIPKYSRVILDWFGGEPLLAMDVIRRMSPKIIEICKANKKIYISSMTTNGYSLSKETLEELIKYRVLQYQITVDGTKETHDSQRKLANGDGTYDTIMNNFSEIHKNVTSTKFKISIRTNFTKPILASFDEYIESLEKVIEDDPRFGIIISVAENWGGPRIDDFKENLLTGGKAASYREVMNYFAKKQTKLRVDSLLSFLSPCSSICKSGQQNYFAFSSDGVIHKCTNIYLQHGNSKIGDASDKGANLDFLEESKWIISPFNILAECDNCYMFPVCLNTTCPRHIYELKYVKNISESEIKKMRFCYPQKDLVDDLMLFSETKGDFFEL